jgi:alkylation response protein AidB-like acyl-CoA dehydrogenase
MKAGCGRGLFSGPFFLNLLRTLARADASVALVASMHPAVLKFAGWLESTEGIAPYRDDWEAQRRWVFQTVRDGAWWGTIVSESGSGGDWSKTRAAARPVSSEPGVPEYRLTGEKSFGSGSGVTSFMITSALTEGESEPDIFFMDMRGVPWDGSRGVKLLAEWDSHGMTATQSHAMAFADFPATRLAWPIHSRKLVARPRGFGGAFATVAVGIVEIAVETARHQLEQRRSSLQPYEQAEWARVEVEAWLIRQAHAAIVNALADEEGGERSGLLGKTAIAELAESVLARICRIVGGGLYARHSPFGYWFEDVRALGFLRPPWALASTRIVEGSWVAQRSEVADMVRP